MKSKNKDSGKLRIGDDWNAIRIIALSQSNPLKAIASSSRTASTRTRKPSRSLAAGNTARIIWPSKMTVMGFRAILRDFLTSSTSLPTYAIRSRDTSKQTAMAQDCRGSLVSVS
jgi:hypothetical protein